MNFGAPAPDAAALERLARLNLLPTKLSSAQLDLVRQRFPELMRAAFVSARTTDYKYLATMRRMLADLIDPAGARAEGRTPLSPAQFRVACREALESIGYSPGAAGVPEGSIEDLASDRRLDLIVQTQTDMHWGAGAHARAQQTLDSFPCQELIRAEPRKVERDWPSRWKVAGREVGDWAALRCLDRNGRMAARLDSDIWTALSRFGLPYPPFDYNSGMWTRPLDRVESVELGLIEPGDEIQPTATPGPADAALPEPTEGAPDPLLAALREVLGPSYRLDDGILRHVRNRMTDRPPEALNYEGQPRDSLGRWVDENGGGLDDRHNIARGVRAARRALSGKQDVSKSMWVPGLGQVDFDWGTPGANKADRHGTDRAGGWGIDHIRAKRGRKAVLALPYTLALGKTRPHERSDQTYRWHEDRVAVLKRKGSKRWRVETHIVPAETEKGPWAFRLKGPRRQVKR